MIRDTRDGSKDKARKPSAEYPAPGSGKNKSNLRSSRSPSLSGVSGFTTDSNYKNKPHGIPRSPSGRPLGKPATSRGNVKHFKKKGKKGGKSDLGYDIIVNIDLQEWQLTDEQVAEYKEVFMLFDKDEDGVLTYPELNVVMKSLGQRPSEKELLRMVREVSEDRIYDTIEFNEFLQMMSKQMRNYSQDSLRDAFRIFDKDDDGLISVEELRNIMLRLGEKMTDKELDEMIAEANCDKDGHIDYEEFVLVLCNDSKKTSRKKQRKAKKRQQQQLNATSGTGGLGTTSEAVTATLPTSSTTLARPPQPQHLTSSSSCNGNLMAAAGAMAGAMATVSASKFPASVASTASATSAKSNLTTTVSVHHNNINVDKKNNNAALTSEAAASNGAAKSASSASSASKKPGERRSVSVAVYPTNGGRSNGAAKNSKTAMPGTDQKNINLVLN